MSRRSTSTTGRLFFALFAVAAFAFLAGCGRASDEEQVQTDTGAAAMDSGVVTTTGVPVLLDLGSDSCVACKTMAPILDELRETFEGQLDVQFVDVWKDKSVAAEHGIKIIPTQIFFDAGGNELFRHQGFFGREDILAKWAELGYTFDEPAEGRAETNG
jgi:thioredoxin 1